MRVISLLVFLGFALVSAASAVAQSSRTVIPSSQNYSSPLFSKLFTPSPTPLLKPPVPPGPPDANAGSRAVLPARPTVKFVCGMAMVPVDPSFDAKIRRPVPRGTFTIKRIKPPVCAQ
jgi:hypothetical protein